MKDHHSVNVNKVTMYAKKDVMQPTEVWLIPSVSLERAEGLGRPVTNPGGYKVHFSHHTL